MNEFQVILNLWPRGVLLPDGVDVNPPAPPTPNVFKQTTQKSHRFSQTPVFFASIDILF